MEELLNKALNAFNNGDIKKSIGYYEKVLLKYPDHETASNNLAYAYFLIREYHKAEVLILQLINNNLNQ